MAVLAVRRVLLVANPAARTGSRRIHAAERALAAAGCAVDLRQTTASGDAERFAMERRDADAVFTLGGDGTVMEVLHALRHTGIPVGIIPAGTGNLMARALAIPLDVDRAVHSLLGGIVRHIDLGCIHSEPMRRFAFGAGVGIDATMIERTTAQAKQRLGVLAYVLAAGAAAFRHDRFHVRIVTEEGTYEHDTSLTLIANFGSVLYGHFALGPGITPDDGRLDVCVYAPRSGWDAVRLVWRIMRRDYRSDGRMYFIPAREVVIECDPPRIFQADGEIVGMSPVRISVDAGAAALLVPRTAASARA
ncbi:MAG TPA: diacylglycerol kinase family protein [Gemmatimonadaceae bacterium]|nr:diacylglycerol kinase family protein [Gemmatimonadaceae bacterium]